LKTRNAEEFGTALEERGYEFTEVHRMKSLSVDEEIFEILKNRGCLPIPNEMQSPY
jgi:hypothetical protein